MDRNLNEQRVSGPPSPLADAQPLRRQAESLTTISTTISTGVSKSEVGRTCADLDAEVTAFRDGSRAA